MTTLTRRMTNQVVKVQRDSLTECMTCPLCDKLLREATTISECLHTFCRKCIYEKLTDEEVDCCPICNIDLGCVPAEKLRPDHNLQDVRAKIFPFKRRKVKAPDIPPPISLPVRRKERSLSSLVVSTPRVSTQIGLTGRRTKAVARNAAALRGSNFSGGEPTKKEEDLLGDNPEASSSPETINKIAQTRRPVRAQRGFTVELSDHKTPEKDTANGAEAWEGKVDLWKPLNCLVEVANRTKSFKHNSQGPVIKSEQNDAPDRELRMPKTKGREHVQKPKVYDSKNRATASTPVTVKPRKHKGRKRAASSMDQPISAQDVIDAMSVKRDRRTGPIWFTLVASDDQDGDSPLPQISASYLRIKDGSLPVSLIQKYIAEKLRINETEVEITCCGQPLVPTLQLHELVDLWLQIAATSQRVVATVGTSAKEFLMALAYARRVQPP